MILCFNCSKEDLKLIEKLLNTGHYATHAEVISFAIKNLAVLQKEVLLNGVVVIGQDSTVQAASQVISEPLNLDSSKTIRKIDRKDHSALPSSLIPPIFLSSGLVDTPTNFASMPPDTFRMGQEISLDNWIFGQQNKLLPAKASCRALAHLLGSESEGVLVEDAARAIAQEVVGLGDYLRHLDEQYAIGRDDALSTAFPTSGKDKEKSCLRYANQFVASVNKQGKVSGLLYDLKLINITGEKKPRLLLTEVGWRFATQPNPVLDDLQETPTQKFTKEEVAHLIDHIACSVPVEDFTYRACLQSIKSGACTPEEMDAALRKYEPRDTSKSLSISFLSSQRSGAISRMADLGLIMRERDGTRVRYRLGSQQYATVVQ